MAFKIPEVIATKPDALPREVMKAAHRNSVRRHMLLMIKDSTISTAQREKELRDLQQRWLAGSDETPME